jgi:hypothetical protein
MALVEAAADVICAVQYSVQMWNKIQRLCSERSIKHKVSSAINMSGGYSKHSLVFA